MSVSFTVALETDKRWSSIVVSDCTISTYRCSTLPWSTSAGGRGGSVAAAGQLAHQVLRGRDSCRDKGAISRESEEE